MTIVKHNPAKNFTSLFDELFNNFPATWGRDVETGFSVPVNIYESNDAYHLELNAPGRNKEDFKINIENGLLTISFEKKEELEQKDLKTLRREFSYLNFKRSFTIDDKINSEGITAKYENGILKLFLPKKEEVKPATKQINIL
ncbi:MAG: Hsp20/alpha crystallin family protein [Bacteroidota bacterium]|nr:Hsp20/alpha crystallin family protein [Bacteroidota bacterium]